MLAAHQDLALKINALERKVGRHDSDLEGILEILRQLVQPPPLPPKRQIGFRPPMASVTRRLDVQGRKLRP